jgi:hypothetical protein
LETENPDEFPAPEITEREETQTLDCEIGAPASHFDGA